MKKFLRSHWIVGIGTTVIGGVALSIVLDLIKQISILSTMKAILLFLWNCVISFLSFEIRLWWLLVFISIIFAILWIISKYHDAKENSSHVSFLGYTQDYFLGHSWEWVWEKNWEGKYGVENLHPICTKCKILLVQSHAYLNQLKCPRCNNTVNFDSSIQNEVMVLIYDNVKKNNFSN